MCLYSTSVVKKHLILHKRRSTIMFITIVIDWRKQFVKSNHLIFMGQLTFFVTYKGVICLLEN